MAVPSPVENGSWAAESEKSLRKMSARAMSRHCISLPIFKLYFKENITRSLLGLLSFSYKGKYQDFPTPAGS